MGSMMRLTGEARGLVRRVSGGSGVSAAVGAFATGLLILVAFGVALVFAATLAVVMVLASALFGLAAMAWRVRPRPARQAIEAARRGHAWIGYDIEHGRI